MILLTYAVRALAEIILLTYAVQILVEMILLTYAVRVLTEMSLNQNVSTSNATTSSLLHVLRS